VVRTSRARQIADIEFLEDRTLLSGGGRQSPALARIPASPTVAPESALTIPGNFDASATGNATTVTFTFKGRYKISEFALAVTSSSVVAAIPIVLNKNAQPASGAASVTVTQVTTTAILHFRSYPQLHITMLPQTSAPVGTITEQFLNADQRALTTLDNAYQTIEAAAPGTISSLISPDYGPPGSITVGPLQGTTMFQQVAALQAQLSQLQTYVAQAAAGVPVMLGTYHHHPMMLTTKALALSDRILSAEITGAESSPAEARVEDASASNPFGDIAVALGKLAPALSGAAATTTAIQLGTGESVLLLGGTALLNVALVATGGLLVGGAILVVAGGIDLALAGNPITAQLTNQSPGDMTAAGQNQSPYTSALGLEQSADPVVDVKLTSAGQVVDGVTEGGFSLYESASGSSDVLQSSAYQTVTNVNASIDSKLDELAQTLGLNPNYGPGEGQGSPGSGSGGGGSGGQSVPTSTYTVVIAGTENDGENVGTLDNTFDVGPTTQANLASAIASALSTLFTVDATMDAKNGAPVAPGNRIAMVSNVMINGNQVTGQFLCQGGSGLLAYNYSGSFTATLDTSN
jgi:ureidoglycolate hydrolase